MGERKRRITARPRLLTLEGRELLSGIVALMAASAPRVPSAISILSRRVAQNHAASTPIVISGNTGGTGSGNTFMNNTNSQLLGNGTASPQEVKRETFHASFTGRVYTSAGRFSDQSTTYDFQGLGGTTFFLHGDQNMAIVTPTDPTKPFVGLSVMNDKSTNSGGIIGLDVTGVRTAVDAKGRPTQLTFTADSNIYSGIFFTDAAQGTLTITYGSNNSYHAVFDGRVYTNGLTNPLVNSALYARGGRPLRLRGH